MPARRRQPKLQGEWVELAFMERVAARGITVSRPHGDSAPFDCVVGRRQPLFRVQVRSTSMWMHGSYFCHLARGGRLVRAAHRNYDVLAVYVVPCAAWYVIPMSAITRGRWGVHMFPHIRNSRGRYEKFRDAWHLFGRRRNIAIAGQ